ncbi:hypothetical protein [Pigmentiphaga litoralis]|uniref:Uncharacterized protein n=1 Tax=Pigmentiphaga litoralis TaxID=516702 RepID=A0A7Y9ITA7_9BURK|nr:hypothetical protein [Pigmentiphaga litoralis]NYE23740.1 hypothetical protein [Pigmentiphaga litoralis]NYE82646.1 hypothetical protein [Pigmentiphaga litoralis]
MIDSLGFFRDESVGRKRIAGLIQPVTWQCHMDYAPPLVARRDNDAAARHFAKVGGISW